MNSNEYRYRAGRRRTRRPRASRIVPVLAALGVLALVWFLPFRWSGTAGTPMQVSSRQVSGDAEGSPASRTAESAAAGDAEVSDGASAASGSGVYVVNSSDPALNTGEGAPEPGSEDGSSGDGAQRPASGHVFFAASSGTEPNLTCVAPRDKDVYVKLREANRKSVVLSFYVRAGDTVRACVPHTACLFQYSTGTGWQGEDAGFAADASYSESERILDFGSPDRVYTYELEADDPNIDPLPISQEDFDGVARGSSGASSTGGSAQGKAKTKAKAKARARAKAKATVPKGSISWKKCASHIGEKVKVRGRVVSTRYASASNGGPTFLNIGAPYPDPDRVTVVIWEEDRGKFRDPPESRYTGKRICVTGRVETYAGACEIKVTSPRQIGTW